MAVDQVPVRELQDRRTYLAVNHRPGIAEEVLVVGALRRRVRDDQGGLPAPARASAALGVVRRRGRHVAHVDGVQGRDVDAKLHRRGAEEHRQESIGLADLPEPPLVRIELLALAFAEAEALLPDLAVVGIDLGGVLARLEPEERVHGGAEHPREVLVEVAEERVLPGTAAVLRRAAQPEEDARVVEAPSGLIERRALLRYEAVRRARTEEVLDELVELLRLQVADGRVAAPEARRAQRSPETTSRAAAHDQLHVAERARPAGGRNDHQPASGSRLLVRAEPPGRPEPAVRLRDHLLQDGGVEHLAADRHPLPHVIEQLAVNRGPDSVVGVLQQGVRVGEQLVVRGEVRKAQVLHPDHAELLQVRIRVPPAASLIEPDAVGQYLPQRALGLLQVEAAERGLQQPLGANLRVRPVEAERALLGDSKLVAAEPVRAGILECAEKARADEADEEEVVEVAGLERRVLTVVGEAEDLSRVAVHRRGCVHPAQCAPDQHGGRRAAALRRERRKPRAVARCAALGVPAAEAEPELAGQEPRSRVRTDAPVGRDHEAAGTRVAVVLLEPRTASSIELEPGLGVVILPVGERERGIVGRMRRQEAERPLGPRIVRISVGFVLPGRWCVVDVAREEDRLSLLLHQPNRVILVAALAAKVHGVEALVRVAGEELLAIDRHRPRTRRLECRVGVAGAGDELVELEREEASLVRVRVRGPFLLGNARHQEEVAQHPAAG